MHTLKAAALVGVISALTIVPAVAVGIDKNPYKPGLGWGRKPAVGTPGPEAGVGLAFLAAAGGGYLVLRFRKRKGPAQTD